jgi:hypothetical protein
MKSVRKISKVWKSKPTIEGAGGEDRALPMALDVKQDVEFILIDVPSCKGWGHSDKTLRGEKKR